MSRVSHRSSPTSSVSELGDLDVDLDLDDDDDDPANPVLRVTIGTLLGGLFILEVPRLTTTVEQLKSMVAHMQGLPVDQQHLVLRGRELRNPELLLDAGVTSGSRLQLVLNLASSLVSRSAPAVDEDDLEYLDAYLDACFDVDWRDWLADQEDVDEDIDEDFPDEGVPVDDNNSNNDDDDDVTDETNETDLTLQPVDEEANEETIDDLDLAGDEILLRLLLGRAPGASALDDDDEEDDDDDDEEHGDHRVDEDDEMSSWTLQHHLLRLQENTRHRLRMADLRARMGLDSAVVAPAATSAPLVATALPAIAPRPPALPRPCLPPRPPSSARPRPRLSPPPSMTPPPAPASLAPLRLRSASRPPSGAARSRPASGKSTEHPAVLAAPRCHQCARRLKIVSTYECRCGHKFCAEHRYAEKHSCGYDYKTEGRRTLAANAPVVTALKLPKI